MLLSLAGLVSIVGVVAVPSTIVVHTSTSTMRTNYQYASSQLNSASIKEVSFQTWFCPVRFRLVQKTLGLAGELRSRHDDV